MTAQKTKAKWTLERATKAQQERKYIKIGPKSGVLMIAGAPARWTNVKNPQFAGDVYVPALRVSGNPVVIANYFRTLDRDVTKELAQAYSAQNYLTTHKAAFDRELADYEIYSKAAKDAKKKKSIREGPVITLVDLQYFADNLRDARVVKKVSVSTASPKSSKNTLLARIAAAKKEQKVMDVSDLKANGKGAIKIKPNSKRYGVKGIAVVSKDKRHFATAMKQLGPKYEKYVALWTGKAGAKSAKSPKRKTTKKKTTRKKVASPKSNKTASLNMPSIGSMDSVEGIPTSPLGSPFALGN